MFLFYYYEFYLFTFQSVIIYVRGLCNPFLKTLAKLNKIMLIYVKLA